MVHPLESESGAPVAREAGHWRPWHTGALVVLTAACAYMAIWRPLDLYASWVTAMVVLTAFVLVTGHGIQGVWRGAFIDERNKVSLSRFQMIAWTVLVLAALGALGIARTLEDPGTGLDIEVPPTIWLVMGISTTSLVGSPLIKRSKEDRLAANAERGNARWSDLLMGEEEGSATFLDIGKVQMFLFTVILVLAYGVAIAAGIRDETLPDSLPEIGEGMLALLGLSHAGYLVGKAAPAARPPGRPASRADSESAPESGAPDREEG